MFERFGESARRVIFFARFETTLDGSDSIRPVHLLLGLQRVSPQMLRRAGLSSARIQEIHAAIVPGRSPETAPPEVPLDGSAQEALVLASRIADQLRVSFVEPAHLLWGLWHADEQIRHQLEGDGLGEEKLQHLIREASAEKPSGEAAPAEPAAEMIQPVWRSGIAYDLHRLADGRKLILGGVEIPFDKGPLGHSDGDVLSHAICDALLGAAGLGDIGTHFPDTDPRWKGASSLLFLERTRDMLADRGLDIVHIDAVVITERPRLGPHFPAMRETLCRALGIPAARINLKAKTNEGVDSIGRGEAIACHAIATLAGRATASAPGV